MKQEKHEFYMEKALRQAKVAGQLGEVPVGAILVDSDEKIVGRGFNKTEQRGCQIGHAEVLAIQQVCKKRGDWRLDGCSLYVTLEPCLMCYGLIHLSRIARVCYAAPSPLFGYEKVKNKKVKEVVASYSGQVAILTGLKQQESVDMLRAFFKNARQ